MSRSRSRAVPPSTYGADRDIIGIPLADRGGVLWRIITRQPVVRLRVREVTVVGLGVASLIGGVVVTETVFAIPGLGRLTVDAILQRDYPVIQGIVLMFSFVYVIINLIVDLLYTLFDPRIRY